MQDIKALLFFVEFATLRGLKVDISERITPMWNILPKRWRVERSFAWIGNCRRLSKDYEISTQSEEAHVYISCVALLCSYDDCFDSCVWVLKVNAEYDPVMINKKKSITLERLEDLTSALIKVLNDPTGEYNFLGEHLLADSYNKTFSKGKACPSCYGKQS